MPKKSSHCGGSIKGSLLRATPMWPPSRLQALLGAGLIALAAFIAYVPALNGGFIWDDELLVTDNALIRAPDSLARIWFTTDPVDYWPLTNTSFWIEWRLWGTNSTGYHVTNLALHIASSLLIWIILRRLSIPGAYLAALLFAVHPVNVESVAWIAQRKNTLSMLFFLLSILWYLKAETPRRWDWYGLSLLAFVLAMLSKGSVAVLPVLLLLLSWWQRGAITQGDLVRTAPFFFIAAALTAVNMWFQTHGSSDAIREVIFLQRLLGAGAVVWFYLYKALVPLNLAFVYPQWNIQVDDWRWWAPLIGAVVVTSLLVWQRHSRLGRPLLLAWLFFCVALLPVMGLTDVYFMKYSLVADHYQYIALVSVVALAAACTSRLYQLATPAARPAILGLAVSAVAGLTFLSHEQSKIYADTITIYQDTLEKNPDSWMAHNNLGKALLDAGSLQEAVDHFQQAVRVKPDYAQAHNNLGFALAEMGRLPEAVRSIEQSLRLKPDYARAHYNLGLAFVKAEQPEEAIEHFGRAVALDPDYADAYNNLGNALSQSGRYSEAIGQYEQLLQLRPDDAVAHNNLGNALASLGRVEEATAHYEQSLRLNPDYVLAQVNLATAYAQSGRTAEAVDVAQGALKAAQQNGQSQLAQQIEVQLESYRSVRTSGDVASPRPGSSP